MERLGACTVIAGCAIVLGYALWSVMEWMVR
jgi:hypothetical protein